MVVVRAQEGGDNGRDKGAVKDEEEGERAKGSAAELQ